MEFKQKMVTLCLSVALMLSLQGCGPIAEPAVPDRTLLKQELTAHLDSIRERSGFSGATLAVLFTGEAPIGIAVGLADPDTGIPLTPDARIFTGSTGKTFFSAALLQLVEEGKLNLDDPISTWFGETDWFNRLPNAGDITVRMLMNHTGGLPRWIMDKDVWTGMLENPDRTWTPVDRLSFVLDREPVHPAGDGWHYSDTDYLLVAMIIEAVTGNDAYAEIQRRFLDLLHLTLTSPSISRDIPGLPQGSSGDAGMVVMPEKVVVDGRYVINPQMEWGGGGFVTNAQDLARWALALYGGSLLKADTMNELLSPVDKETGQPSETGYGLGVFVEQTPVGTGYGHSGIFPGYLTFMMYYPELECSLAFQLTADRFSGKVDRNLADYAGELIEIVNEHQSKP